MSCHVCRFTINLNLIFKFNFVRKCSVSHVKLITDHSILIIKTAQTCAGADSLYNDHQWN